MATVPSRPQHVEARVGRLVKCAIIARMPALSECVREDTIVAFLAGQLTDPEAAHQLESHVDGCPACRRLVDEAAKLYRQDATYAGSSSTMGSAPTLPPVLGTGEVNVETLRTVSPDEYLIGRELA